jgi:RNA polymerase-binding transcription factor DksA
VTTTRKQPAPAAAKAAVKSSPAPAPVKKRAKKTVICELSGFEVTPSPANLSPKTLDRLKQRLLEERERLLRQSEELAAEAEQLARDRDGGDTQFDEESGEGDTVNVERERDLLLSASARQDVEDIDGALARMKRGTYGVCRYAGRRLPLERLELLPWADVCVDCKARAERRR